MNDTPLPNEGFAREYLLPDGTSRFAASTGIACERCGHLNVLKPFFVVCAFGRPSPSTMAGVHTGQVMRVVQGLGPGVVQQDDHSDRPGGEEQQADPSGGGGTSSMPPSFIDAPPPRGNASDDEIQHGEAQPSLVTLPPRLPEPEEDDEPGFEFETESDRETIVNDSLDEIADELRQPATTTTPTTTDRDVADVGAMRQVRLLSAPDSRSTEGQQVPKMRRMWRMTFDEPVAENPRPRNVSDDLPMSAAAGSSVSVEDHDWPDSSFFGRSGTGE